MNTSAPEDLELSTLDRRYQTLRVPQPELMEALRGSLKRDGLLHPLLGHRHAGSVVLLDGFKRCELLRESDTKVVAVRLLEVSSPAQAKAAIFSHNAPHRGLNVVEEAMLVRSLVEVEKLSQLEVSRLLGRHKSWVCRRLTFIKDIAPSLIEELRLGLVSVSVLRELVRLPRGNQERVAKAVSLQGLTSRQCSALVRLLETTEEAHWAEVLAAPQRYLATSGHRGKQQGSEQSVVEPLSDLSQTANLLRTSMIRFERSALALEGSLHRLPSSTVNTKERNLLEVLGSQCSNRAEQVIERLGAVLGQH